MRFDRTDLLEAIRHLAFDIHYFRFYNRIYNDCRLITFSLAVRQAVLYALLLHFRVLLDFFYKEPVQDDCGVKHFELSEFAGFPETSMPADLKAVSMNLNKRLAHMTATRWKEEQPDMGYYSKHFKSIEVLLAAFQAALPDELRQALVGRLQELEVRDRWDS